MLSPKVKDMPEMSSFKTAGGPSQSDRREKEIRHGYIGKEEIEPSFTCHDALDKAKL